MKGRYLSIGELAKLKNVSIKSLRYYDRIGILKPAWVNPDTGYRYYTTEQIIVLDVILLCLAFDLPLKTLKDKGISSPDLKGIIREGQQHAERKLEEYRRKLKLSRDITEQIERLDMPADDLVIYTAAFGRRSFLTRKWEPAATRDGSAAAYLSLIYDLHEEARERDLTILSQQGIIKDMKGGCDMVFLAVEWAGDEDLLTLEEGPCSCMVMEEEDLSDLHRILLERGMDAGLAVCLNTDIYDYCLTSHLHRVEVQIPALSPL